MPCLRLVRVVLLACLPLCYAAAAVAEEPVARGPAHEPVPYRYDPGLLRKVPRAFLDNGPACCLYDAAACLVERDGTVEEVYHQVVRLNNRKGVETFGEYHLATFDPSYQKLTLNQAGVYKAGAGPLVPVRPQDLQVRDSNTDYLDCHRRRELLISFRNLTVGDVIEVQWTLRGKDPDGHGQWYDHFVFGYDEYPTVRSELRVRLDKDRVLHYATTGTGIRYTVRDEGATRLHTWRTDMRPPLPAEDRLPRKGELRSQVRCSTFASWQDVGAWYRLVHQGCWECTDEVRRKAVEVTRQARTAEDKARLLTNWVRRHVRYLSLHPRDSYAPHPPARVLANRYGDCKDQSQLLAVMLRAVGVPAAVATLSGPDESPVLEALPSPGGTHAIVLATIEGRDRWIDPVFADAAWDVLPADDHDRLTFVVDEAGTVRLVRTPPLKPEDNRTELTVHLSLRADGSARGEATWVYQGLAAAVKRQAWLWLTESGRRQAVLHELQQVDDSARLDRVIEDESLRDLDNPLRLRATFELSGLFGDSTPGLPVRDTRAWEEVLHDKPPADRKVAVWLGEPRELRQRFIIQLPAAFHVADQDSPHEEAARSPWCSYIEKVSQDKSRRQAAVEFRTRLEKPRVEPADLPAFRKFVKEATNLSSAWLALEPVTKPEDAAALAAELQRDPGDRASALILAQLYRKNHQPDKARDVLQQALSRKSDDEKLLGALIEVADDLKQRGLADQYQSYLQLARNGFRRGDLKSAAEYLKEAHDAHLDAPTAEYLELEGQLSEAQGRRKEATAAYEAWLKLQPTNTKPLEGLVRLALAAGDRREALDRWRHYAVAVGTEPAGLATAADFALRLEHYDDALDLAWRARKGKLSPALLRVFGLAYLHRAEYARAEENLAAALAATPASAAPDGQVLEGLIRANLALGHLNRAMAHAGQAARVAAPSAELRRLCGVVVSLEQRRVALEKSCPVPHGRDAGTWSRRIARFVCAEQAQAEGRPAAEVDQLLNSVLVGGVEFGPAYGLRGLRSLECGRLTQALADADKALALSPAEPRGYLVRGRVRLERAAPGALADLEKAASLSHRQDAEVLHWLAAALAQSGRCREAVAAAREAVRLRPGAKDWLDELHQLESAAVR